MKKLIIGSIFLASALTALLFSGCFLFDDKSDDKVEYTEVSSFAELKMGGNIKLTRDIDCEYETIGEIACKNFDGQGYTIKNCIINSTEYYSMASFFARGAGTIANVTFDNIKVNGSNGLGAAVVSVGDCEKIENVHVKNSSISCGQVIQGSGLGRGVKQSYVGGIYGGYFPSLKNGNPTKGFDCQIVNCSVENTTIEINGYKGSSSNNASMYLGGIAGGCNNIKGCSVKNCKITATASDIFNYPYVGGIVGCSEGSIENSYAENNSLIAWATYYQANILEGYSSSKAYAGGVVAYANSSKTISCCYSDSNELYVSSSGDIYAGGLAGYVDGTEISQCYSKNANISMVGYSDKANSLSPDSVHRRAGGLIGSSNNNSVTSCFAYNGDTIAEQCVSMLNKDLESKTAGLIAGFSSVSVMYCATYNEKLVSTIIDEFIPADVGKTFGCYVTKTKFGNVNNCDLVDDAFWDSPNTIKERLSLMSNYWKFSANKLPYLDFSDNN